MGDTQDDERTIDPTTAAEDQQAAVGAPLGGPEQPDEPLPQDAPIVPDEEAVVDEPSLHEPEPEPLARTARRRPAPLAVSFIAPVMPEAPEPADLEEAAPPRRRRSRPAGSGEPSDGPAAGDTAAGDSARGARSTDRGPDRQADSKDRQADSKDRQASGGPDASGTDGGQDGEPAAGTARRRRRRGGSGGGGEGDADPQDAAGQQEPRQAPPGPEAPADEAPDEPGEGEPGTGKRRRRRRRRAGEDAGEGESGGRDAEGSPDDEVQGVKGSTRLEARRQRRRESRDQSRRPSILSEAEFLSRRESVERVMAVRERGGRTQVGVLEDGMLVEHYVATSGSGTMVGNVYVGRVQNVLPSMEAAFIDIGKGRNAILYSGEVNWDASGLEGKPRLIEHALSPGQLVLVQVTKEPIGTKGARLTSQISLPGRFVVYVPDGSLTGISRKLPDTERKRLRDILGRVVPDDAGVIVRTAAEGASEEELTRDIARLTAQWETIVKQRDRASGPTLLSEEPDMLLRVVRDLFNEDFARLVVQGDGAWDSVQGYISHVAPDLLGRVERWDPATYEGRDLFGDLRIEEQIRKALDRKVWLPSGGYLVIDRTEAMTVVDVNTGKYTGAGGNLEETVTRNNLEAAEEIVRQLRLRDIGGIIVVDFVDMVLSGNRDLVLRRLVECLGRDRTRHQVAEVTSLGLVQMTRKRVAAGLLEAFSETCECCHGRGIVIHEDPVSVKPAEPQGRSGGRGRKGGKQNVVREEASNGASNEPSNGASNGDAPVKDASAAAAATAAIARASRAGRTEDGAEHASGTGVPSDSGDGEDTEQEGERRSGRRRGGRRRRPAPDAEVGPGGSGAVEEA